MAKFYVKTADCQRVLMAATPLAAATKSVSTWKRENRKMGTSIRVSEVGFEATDHPHHALDTFIPTTFVKRKLLDK